MYLLTSLFSWNHMHPILVHFTTALLPVSVASDFLGRFGRRSSLTSAGWWTLLYGAIATPLTVFAGWMWSLDLESMASMGPDPTMTTHQWLGTGLVFGFLILAIWRGRTYLRDKKPGLIYFAVAVAVTGALMFQGYLGGKMTLG